MTGKPMILILNKFNKVNQVMVILVQHLKLVKRNTVFQTLFVSHKIYE